MKTLESRYRGICPICGQEFVGHPAVSRLDNETLICPMCGIRQALETIGVTGTTDQNTILSLMQRREGGR